LFLFWCWQRLILLFLLLKFFNRYSKWDGLHLSLTINNFPFISRLQKFILSLFISSKNDLLSVCTCIHIYRYTRSSWENVNLDVCYYVLIAMPLQSQEILNITEQILNITVKIVNRFKKNNYMKFVSNDFFLM
jgi:hypothetical protein